MCNRLARKVQECALIEVNPNLQLHSTHRNVLRKAQQNVYRSVLERNSPRSAFSEQKTNRHTLDSVYRRAFLSWALEQLLRMPGQRPLQNGT